MRAIREASAASDGEGWTLGSVTAVAVVIFVWAVLWQFLRRRTDDWRIQFFVLFAWLTSSIPLIQLALHRHFLPQPNRYKFEMEMALCLAVVFGLRPWIERMLPPSAAPCYWSRWPWPPSRRWTIASWKRSSPPRTTSPRPSNTAPPPGRRKPIPTSASSCPVPWRSGPTPTPTSSSSPAGLSPWRPTRCSSEPTPPSDSAPPTCSEDVHLTLTWLKAYGVGVVAISGKDSQEYWRPFTHPEKFDGVLPALWKESGVTMYRVPLREFTLAHIVPEGALVRRAPRSRTTSPKWRDM